MNNAHAFFQFLANQHFGHEGLPPFLFGRRRNYRRTGNLQDTEEDFGPEDYEVIRKINSIDYFLFSLYSEITST